MELKFGIGVMRSGFSLAAQIVRANQGASDRKTGFLFSGVGEGRARGGQVLVLKKSGKPESWYF